MAVTCAVLECCDNSSVRAIINASQSNWPSGGFIQGRIYSVSYAGKSSCFTAVYVNNPCNYSGSYGYTVNTSAIISGGAGFNSCSLCYDAEPKSGNCDEVLVPLPTPTPTPTSTETPTPTPTPTVTPTNSLVLTRFVATKCCDGTSLILSTYDTVVVGNIVLYNGDCYEVTTLNPPGGGPTVSKVNYADCTACINENPCAGTTPTPTPTSTPTPTPTPSTSPSSSCCSNCTEYRLRNLSPLEAPNTVTYTDCNGYSASYTFTTPGEEVFICACSTTEFSGSEIEANPTGESCTNDCDTVHSTSCTKWEVTIIEAAQTVQYTDCFRTNGAPNTTISVILSPGVHVICSCTQPQPENPDRATINPIGSCPCESTTPTPTPTSTSNPSSPTPTPTPSITPTSSVTPTPSITPTSSVTPTPSITPTSSVTPTPSITPTSSVTPTPSITPTSSVTPTPSITPTSSVTPTPSVTPTSSVTPTPSITPTSSVTPTPSITPTSSVTPTPSITPTSSVTPHQV